MNRTEVIASLVLSAHALARIAAQDAGNDAPSAQWRTLGILERRGSLRLGELAAEARTTQPGMTRLIGTLDQAGLVSRAVDPADTRATLVSATPAGLQAIADWRIELRDTLAPRFSGLGEDDWGVLHRAAEILAFHSQQSTKTGDAA